jgi:2-keto-3-deoxy-galactonokinase
VGANSPRPDFDFSTYMTGELYAVLLATASGTARLAAGRGLPPAQDAFVAGDRRGLAGSGFRTRSSARTRALMGECSPTRSATGCRGVARREIAAARHWLGDAALRAPVRVIGSDALAQRLGWR